MPTVARHEISSVYYVKPISRSTLNYFSLKQWPVLLEEAEVVPDLSQMHEILHLWRIRSQCSLALWLIRLLVPASPLILSCLSALPRWLILPRINQQACLLQVLWLEMQLLLHQYAAEIVIAVVAVIDGAKGAAVAIGDVTEAEIVSSVAVEIGVVIGVVTGAAVGAEAMIGAVAGVVAATEAAAGAEAVTGVAVEGEITAETTKGAVTVSTERMKKCAEADGIQMLHLVTRTVRIGSLASSDP
jgi:hypothetical protein